MKIDKKILLLIQILISLCFIIYWIQNPVTESLIINQNTGDPLSPAVAFIIFNFILFIFGSLWAATIFVLIIETYIFFKNSKMSLKSIHEEYNQNFKFSFYIGYISVLIILLTWI